jgi:hypothetical protein
MRTALKEKKQMEKLHQYLPSFPVEKEEENQQN